MSIKSWIKSLLIPLLSVSATSVFLLYLSSYCSFSEIACTAILGLVCGGIVPLFLIIYFKVDLSKYFVGKMILLLVLAILIVPAWIYVIYVSHSGNEIVVLPAVIFVSETVYAVVKGDGFKTKICLVLSSMVHVYSGFLIDFVRDWH